MPRVKKSEIVLAANLQEAAIVNQIITQSPVAGEMIECKTENSYTKELVNEVDEAKLIRTNQYYKWKAEEAVDN